MINSIEITVIKETNEIQVKDENDHYTVYGYEQRDKFLAEVEGAENYVEFISNKPTYVAPALTEQDFTIAIQAHLDMTAQKTRWDNMQSARSCAGIPLDGTETDIEVAMHTDAVKLARWYLKVWAYGYAQLDLINKSEREVPVSVEAFIAELPLLN